MRERPIISDFFMVGLLGINAPTDLYQVLLGQKNTTAVAATELKELVGQRKREGDLEAQVGIEPTSCSLRSYKNAYGQAMVDAGWY